MIAVGWLSLVDGGHFWITPGVCSVLNYTWITDGRGIENFRLYMSMVGRRVVVIVEYGNICRMFL